jgi:S-adenosylmethionine synthetase
MKTGESVTPKHPDKLCDRISDAILDECLKQDPMSRVAIETMGGHGIITITGELTTKAEFIDAQAIAKRIAGEEYGVTVNIVSQSPEIAQGVDADGAGDQGIMVGYACDDNEAKIPQELFYARDLCKFIYQRHAYDGKTQITINDKKEIETIVASFQKVSGEALRVDIDDWMTKNKIKDIEKKIYTNPAGDWNQGGFEADTGLTGRKLAVDNYGPQIPIGGGAFSGKDATKVDRSGAYMARKIAVDILERCKAHEVMVKLAYAIGVAEPVMATAEVDGIHCDLLTEAWKFTGEDYDLTPKGIIERLKLREPQFEKTAQWGHMGNDFTWDK